MWQTLEVNGGRVELLEPPGVRPSHALLFLHDLDGQTLSQNAAMTELLLDRRLSCLCPHGEQSWWSDRPCGSLSVSRSAERWLLDEVLPMIDLRLSLPTRVIAVAGTGMGGQGALRLAFKHPQQFPIVAAIDASLDHYELHGSDSWLNEMYPSREHCRQDSAILHIHPVRQPSRIWFGVDPANRWYRGNDRLHEKLAALGVAHSFQSRPVGIDEMIVFLLDALTEESRRLL